MGEKSFHLAQSLANFAWFVGGKIVERMGQQSLHEVNQISTGRNLSVYDKCPIANKAEVKGCLFNDPRLGVFDDASMAGDTIDR